MFAADPRPVYHPPNTPRRVDQARLARTARVKMTLSKKICVLRGLESLESGRVTLLPQGGHGLAGSVEALSTSVGRFARALVLIRARLDARHNARLRAELRHDQVGNLGHGRIGILHHRLPHDQRARGERTAIRLAAPFDSIAPLLKAPLASAGRPRLYSPPPGTSTAIFSRKSDSVLRSR